MWGIPPRMQVSWLFTTALDHILRCQSGNPSALIPFINGIVTHDLVNTNGSSDWWSDDRIHLLLGPVLQLIEDRKQVLWACIGKDLYRKTWKSALAKPEEDNLPPLWTWSFQGIPADNNEYKAEPCINITSTWRIYTRIGCTHYTTVRRAIWLVNLKESKVRIKDKGVMIAIQTMSQKWDARRIESSGNGCLTSLAIV